jgi:hypothetical protein
LEKFFYGLLIAILGGLILWFFQILKEYENRLTKLETKFDIYVDSSERTHMIGNYPYITYTGVDVTADGEVLLKADIDLLSEEFRWRCASITDIVRGDKSENLGEVIANYRDDVQLQNALGIVCVGTASSEGNTKGEERRASDRVETLLNLVNSNLTSKKILPIYGLNFGKYNTDTNIPCSDATLEQRRIILIKIIERSEKVTDDKLEASLKRILVEKASNPTPRFPIDIRNYSMFTSGQTMLVYGRNQPK